MEQIINYSYPYLMIDNARLIQALRNPRRINWIKKFIKKIQDLFNVVVPMEWYL